MEKRKFTDPLVIGRNHSADNIEYISSKIREYSTQYIEDYSKCYYELEKYMKGSLNAIALNKIGGVGKTAGEAIANTPLIRKGPVDEALIAAGEKINEIGSRRGKSAMREFREHRDAGVQIFLENIEVINEISNRPVEILFDSDSVYIA